VWRSGIGVTASGAVVLVAGNRLSAPTLANLLLRAGAVRAMELDINRDWTSFILYRSPHGQAIEKNALPDMWRAPSRYDSASSRDFVALYLFELPNIVGVKDATGDVGRVSRQRHAMGSDFIQLSGEDMTALAAMAAGGHGCISVTANIAPGPCAELMEAIFKGDWAHALKIQDRLTPLHAAIFAEPGVNGTKYALSVLGRIQADTRLPLVPVGPATEALIRRALVHAGLLNA